MINPMILCEGETPKFIFYASDIPSYIYYIFLPSIISTFILGLFVFLKNKKDLASKIFFALSVFMVIWMISMLGNWAQNDSGFTLFFDQLNLLIAFIPAIFLYFIIVNFYKKEPSVFQLSLIFLPLLPLLFLMSTKFNINAVDLAWCDTSAGNLYWYLSFLLIVYSIINFLLLLNCAKKEKNKSIRMQILLVLFGFIAWVVLSAILAVVFSIFGYTRTTLWAPISCIIFTSSMTWAVVKYKFLNIKTIAAQVLTVVIWILIASQFFFIQTPINRILNGIALLFSLIIGYMLIKSIKMEVERKEQLQLMADSLAVANDKLRILDKAKTEFISIASHQLRTPVTAIKGFSSLLLEGSYGEVSAGVKGALEKVFVSSERLVNLIEDLLNVSRIESGRLTFTFEMGSLNDILQELYDSFILVAKAKKFYLDLKVPENPLPKIKMDAAKIRELISNFIDNAFKYTEKGGVTVKAEIRESGVVIDEDGFVKEGEKSPYGKVIRVTVSDTGIGVPREEIPSLFKKFSRGKDVSRLHVGGTGLGLFVGKAIADAHHGATWVESDGEGKGSRFIIEIPLEAQV